VFGWVRFVCDKTLPCVFVKNDNGLAATGLVPPTKAIVSYWGCNQTLLLSFRWEKPLRIPLSTFILYVEF
jgi:hypothetical protein